MSKFEDLIKEIEEEAKIEGPRAVEEIDLYRKHFKRKVKEILEDSVDDWHKSNSPKSIYEFMGLTREEYNLFVKGRWEALQLSLKQKSINSKGY